MIHTRRGLVLIALGVLASGLSVLARGDDDDDVTPDEPRALKVSPFHQPVRLAAADGVIDSGAFWGHSSPWLVDIESRGVKDLVVGDFSGLFRVYRNEGTDKDPRYAKLVNLKAGGEDAKVPIY
jgi:hypothetical protein